MRVRSSGGGLPGTRSKAAPRAPPQDCPMAPRHQILLPLAAVLSLASRVQLGSAEVKAEPVRFNRDIRPILAENCFLCHGPDPGVRKAGLRLDRESDATSPREGSAAIVPGDPAASLVIRRIRSQDPSEVMPPPESKKKLDPAAMALLERWIAQGAPYEPHWAFVPPRRPEVPEVKFKTAASSGAGGKSVARSRGAGRSASLQLAPCSGSVRARCPPTRGPTGFRPLFCATGWTRASA